MLHRTARSPPVWRDAGRVTACLAHSGRRAGQIVGVVVTDVRTPVPVVAVLVIRVIVVGIAVIEIRVGGLIRAMLLRVDAQLGSKPIKVSAATAVLQLAGHLDLLGLGSSAPHW